MQFIKMLKNTFKFDLSFQALKEVEQRRGKIVWVGGEKTEKKTTRRIWTAAGVAVLYLF